MSGWNLSKLHASVARSYTKEVQHVSPLPPPTDSKQWMHAAITLCNHSHSQLHQKKPEYTVRSNLYTDRTNRTTIYSEAQHYIVKRYDPRGTIPTPQHATAPKEARTNVSTYHLHTLYIPRTSLQILSAVTVVTENPCRDDIIRSWENILYCADNDLERYKM